MREITGGAGARVAFDPVAGALLPQLAEALALGGIVIEYGALAAEQAPFPLFAVLGKRLSVHGYRYKRVGGDPAKLDAARASCSTGSRRARSSRRSTACSRSTGSPTPTAIRNRTSSSARSP